MSLLDIATLGLRIDARQVRDGDRALDDLGRTGQRAEQQVDRTNAAMARMAKMAKAVAGALAAISVYDTIKEITLLASRYNELGIVMNTIGRNAGKNASDLAAVEEALKKTGISALQSREAITKLISANIDLGQATKLARLAQDAAVIAGTNSSEAFARLIKGIQSAEKETLETMGLNVNFQQSYEKLAKSLGKTVDSLTPLEKTQAGVNAVMEKAPLIAGAYEASLTNAGKQMRSMARYVEDLKVKLGQPFQNPFADLIGAGNAGLKFLTENVETIRRIIQATIDAFAPAIKIAAAYFALFVAGPAIYAAVAAALTKLVHTVALYAMNVAIGQANTIGLNTALWGTSVSAQLAAGSLTKAGLAANVLFAAFAGWQIGKYLEDQFDEVKIFAELLTGAILELWEDIKLAGKLAADAVTVVWRELFSWLTGSLSTMYSGIATGLDKVGFSEKAAQVQDFADRVKAAGESQGTFASRTAEAWAEHERNTKAIQATTTAHVAAIMATAKLTEGAKAAAAAKKAEAAATKELTKEQKAAINAADDFIKNQLRELEEIGKTEDQILMLNAARAAAVAPLEKQRKAIMANALAILTEKKAWDAAEAARKAAEDEIGEDAQSLLDLDKRIAGLKLEIQLHGQTADAAIEAELAKVRSVAASLAISEDYRDQLNQQIEKLEQIKKLQGDKSGLDKAKKAMDDAATAAERMSERIEDALTDALMRGFESGKGFAENMFSAIENMAKTEIVQPFVKGVFSGETTNADGTKTSGMTQTAKSVEAMYNALKSGGTMEKSIANGVQGAFDKLGIGGGGEGSGAGPAAQWAGKLGATVAGYFMGDAVNKGISRGFETGSGFMKMQKVGTAVASYFFGPIGGMAAGAVGGLVNRAFGMKAKEYGATTLNGTFGAGGFTGSRDTAWTQKGGWFRSDKSGVDKVAVDAEMAAMLSGGYDALKAAAADFALTLGANADSLATRTQALSIALTGDAAKDQQAIADYFANLGDTIALELVPSIAQFRKEGETAAGTLERLATGYALIDAALNSIGMAFNLVGVESLAARQRLIDLSGGLDSFAQNTAAFAQNFLTEDQRRAPVIAAVRKELDAMGYAAIDTREEFAALVLALDPATQAGAELYGKLIQLQGAFAEAYPAIEKTADALERLKAAGEAARNDALTALQRAVDAEKAIKQKAFEDTIKGFDSAMGAARNKIGTLSNLSSILGSGRDSLAVEGDRAGAQAALQAMLATARAGGAGTLDADKLKQTLSTLAKESDGYGSSREAMADRYQTAIAVGELTDITDDALSIEERNLERLERLRQVAEEAHASEMAYYDEMLVTAQRQIDAANGNITATMTVTDALANIANLLKPGAYGLSDKAASDAAIVGAYGNALGRAPDAAGMAWWQEKAAQGVSQDAITRAIATSAEAQDKIEALYQSILGRSSDEAGKAWWSDRMADGMSLAEVESLIRGSSENKGNDDVVEAVNAMKSELKLVMTAVASNTQRAATANEDSARQARQKEGAL